MDEIVTIVVAGVVGGAAEVAICGGRSSPHGGYAVIVVCVLLASLSVMRKYVS